MLDVDLGTFLPQYVNAWEGTDRLLSNENLTGGALDDPLRGSNGANAIYGIGGDGVIDGGAGSYTAS